MIPRTEGFEAVLQMLRARAEQYFGDPRAHLLPVARIDRPFSALLRLRITTRDATSHAFLKVYKPRPRVAYEPPMDMARMVEDEYAATRRLHTALAGRPGLAAPRPISVFPDRQAIVTEEIEGRRLDWLLRTEIWARWSRSPRLDAIGARIGAWIREYQRLGGTAGTLSLAEERDYIDERLRHITPRILSADDRARALGLFDDLAAQVTAEGQPLVAIHADLCPGNILITPGGGVSVLDFAMAQSGTRFHDAAHLFLHLDRLRTRRYVPAPFVPSIQAALLRGCDGPGPEPDPLFRLMLLRHVICHVTQLAERSAGWLDSALCWLIRRRWQAGLTRLGSVRPAQPLNLPIH